VVPGFTSRTREIRNSNLTPPDSQSEAELTQVGAVIEAVYNAASSTELYQSIVRIIPSFFSADRASVSIYHADAQEIEFVALHGLVDDDQRMQHGKRLPISKSYEQYHDSVSTPEIWSPVAESDGDNTNVPKGSLRKLGFISVMNCPIYDRSRIVGTLNLGSKSVHFSDKDLALLVQIASLIGIAAERIRNTTVQAAAARRNRLYAEHLELLNRLGEKLSLVGETDEAFELISDCSKELVNAERVSYCVLEPDGKNIKIMGLVGNTSDKPGLVLSLERSGLSEVLIDGRQRYSTELLQSESASQRSLGNSGYNHLWSLPIVAADEIKGALNIASKSMSLDSSDATSVLATLSRFLGSALQRIEAQQQTNKMIEEVEHRARTDMLTGLPNRVEFHRQLQEAMQQADDCGFNVGVLFLDLDLFKNVNDTLGHAVGDQLLCDISRRLEITVGTENTVARIGGDEFLILYRRLVSQQSLHHCSSVIIDTIGQPLNIAERTLEVGVSIGAVCYPQDGKNAEELVKNADIAMYHAKALGRNQCQVFNDALAASVSRRVRLESLLRSAIANDEFTLVFQPQFDFAGNRTVAVEALIRWNHPQEGFIPPDEFISIAEQVGVMDEITDWVIHNSLAALKTFRQIVPDLKVAVNVSASEFSSHSDLFERVTWALQSAGLEADALELELTETALLSHPEHASALIEKLSAQGIQIAIDDFGTGYASLSYLIQLPINTIKIDRSFVDGVESDARKQSVVEGILAIAGGMGLYSVGEGAETLEQMDWLCNNGCDSVQGYFLSKPVTADQIPQTLSELSGLDKAA
jgi:diguanylate cyclase (GGDEF)-like protein